MYKGATRKRASSGADGWSSTSAGDGIGLSSTAATHTSTSASSERMPTMTASTPKASESVITAFPIRSDDDLARALAEMGPLLNSGSGSEGESRLEVLSVLVRDYEARHHPIPPPDPIDAILFRLEQQGLTTKALEGVIGSRTRVFEVLKKKRPLTLSMIRRLHERFGIPLKSLVATA